LVSVTTNAVKTGNVEVSRNIDFGTLREIQMRATTIHGLIAFATSKTSIGVEGQAEPATGQFVSGNYYSLLGVPALIGRTFEAKDDVPDGRFAVLGFGYWHSRFGGDPGVIGRSITVNNVPFTIVGVTPRDFYGTMLDQPPDVTIPQATGPQVNEARLSAKEKKPEDSVGSVDARLKPGVTAQQAAQELTGLFQAVLMGRDERERESIQKTWIVLEPAGQGFSPVRGRFSEPLQVLMGVVALVMLIACANIANLLLARASARQREIAIRLSLGSTRWRLMRQLLTESLLLSLLGGALGVLVAAWARSGIIAIAGVESAIPVQWNWRVLAFTAGVCILNAVLFGIVPALRATGIDFAETLKSSRSGRTAGRLPIARILVATQVALSLTLLVGAGLFLDTFRNLNQIDLGYDRDHELMVTLDSRTAGYKDAGAKDFYRQVLERVGTLPGVRSVSLMSMRLMTGNIYLGSVHVPGYTPKKGENSGMLWAISNEVGAGFLNTSGLHLLAGRDFSARDDGAAPRVAIINETMAKHFFADRDPIGQQMSTELTGARVPRSSAWCAISRITRCRRTRWIRCFRRSCNRTKRAT
jgi:predicted permease